jgi:hypothetical protein
VNLLGLLLFAGYIFTVLTLNQSTWVGRLIKINHDRFTALTAVIPFPVVVG